MRQDSRLPRILHALLHLDRHEGPATSDEIGRMLATNPALVRRTMAGLRERGLVSSEKGHGGGWRLARPLSEITLLAIYEALGEPRLFAIGTAGDAPDCLLEQAANAATAQALAAAEALFRDELSRVTMAEIASRAEARAQAAGVALPGA